MIMRYLITVCALTISYQVRAANYTQQEFYADMERSIDKECRAFAEQALVKMGANRFGPRQIDSLRNEFFGGCYGREHQAIDNIDDGLSTGHITVDSLDACTKRVDRSAYTDSNYYAKMAACSYRQ